MDRASNGIHNQYHVKLRAGRVKITVIQALALRATYIVKITAIQASLHVTYMVKTTVIQALTLRVTYMIKITAISQVRLFTTRITTIYCSALRPRGPRGLRLFRSGSHV